MGECAETVGVGGKDIQFRSCQAHNISSGQKEDRSRTAGTVGEGEGAAEEGCLEPTEPAASMRQAFLSIRVQKYHLRICTSQPWFL